MKVLSAPIDVCLGITSKCNFNCSHCLLDKKNTNDLTTKELIDLIDQLGYAKVFNISLFGGEPLIHPDFFLIVRHLRKYPIQVSLNTNATLIDRNVAKELKNYGINGTVVSFDGSTPDIMDKMRGKGSFEKCIRGIENLRREQIFVLLSCTITKYNYTDVENMVLLAKKLNVNGIRFNHVFYGGNAACNLENIRLTPNEEKKTINIIYELSKRFKGFITGSYLTQREKLENVKNYHPQNHTIKVNPCGAATQKCCIRPDGWVTPCEIIWDVKVDNVRNKQFIEIWQKNEIMNEFRMPIEISLENMHECKNCQYQYICFIGHRCYPYFYPNGIKNKKLYCWKYFESK
jgi:radical SAM protein with 4Fe4S-binding SPASM domain